MSDLRFDEIESFSINGKEVESIVINGVPAYEGGGSNGPLCFTSVNGQGSIRFVDCSYGYSSSVTLQYKHGDNGAWQNYYLGDSIYFSNVGDKIYFKGNNPYGINQSIFSYYSEWIQFQTDNGAQIKASGNIMSLIDEVGETKTIPNEYCFAKLFEGCTGLLTPPSLPATTLTHSCYYDMFACCTSLTKAPKLPATTLAQYCYYGMFCDCKSLTKAPSLPATQLAYGCYYGMFYGCSDLTTAPSILPATQLAGSCYYGMFKYCSDLTYAPELPATQLANSCYKEMFSECSSLIEAPELPSRILDASCYDQMFVNCTSLTQAPNLFATTLASSCYEAMFMGCTSIVEAPELLATILAPNCYSQMFQDCTSLTQAPELPAINLASDCYKFMFMGCTSLVMPPELPAKTLNYYNTGMCYYGMFEYCENLETIPALEGEVTTSWDYDSNQYGYMFYGCPKIKMQSYADETCKNKYIFGTTPNSDFANNMFTNFTPNTKICYTNARIIGQTPNYIKVESYSGSDTYTISVNSIGDVTPNLQYSYDTKNWNDVIIGEEIELHGEAIKSCYLRGKNLNGLSIDENNYVNISSSCEINVSGELMMLIDYENPNIDIPNDYCFYGLFKDCTLLKSIGNKNGYPQQIPMLEFPPMVTAHCYESMFEGTSIWRVADVELPAMTLKDSCYKAMFKGTQVSAPMASDNWGLTLPATTLDSNCYESMFENCPGSGGWSTLPMLQATTLAPYCCKNMFKGCTGLGSITIDLSQVTTLAEGCYYGMFEGCTRLLYFPQFPVTTLKDSCYENMFKDCTSLTSIPTLPATTLAPNCYKNMFNGCTNMGSGYSKQQMITTGGLSGAYISEKEVFPVILSEETATDMFANTSFIDIVPLQKVYYNNNSFGSLAFQAMENNSFVKVNFEDLTYEWKYSSDNKNWTTMSNVSSYQFDLQEGEFIFLKHDGRVYHNGLIHFEMGGKIKSAGNVNSFVYVEYGSSSSSTPGYKELFKDCTSLIVAPYVSYSSNGYDGQYCYGGNSLYEGCSNLEIMPHIMGEFTDVKTPTGVFKNCSKIKISLEQSEEYSNAYIVPVCIQKSESSRREVVVDLDWFEGTGGEHTGTVKSGSTVYTSNIVAN